MPFSRYAKIQVQKIGKPRYSKVFGNYFVMTPFFTMQIIPG
jgi:hypothetical protein